MPTSFAGTSFTGTSFARTSFARTSFARKEATGSRLASERCVLILAIASGLAASLPQSAGSETCRCVTGGTWGDASGDVSAGTIDWGSSCTPDEADDFELGCVADLDDQLASATSPITGNIALLAGGCLNVGAGEQLHAAGSNTALDGSCLGAGDGWRGAILAAIPAPASVAYPNPREIELDFSATVDADGDGVDEGALPWPLCDPAGAGVSCGASTLHPADADAGELSPATHLYVDFQKFDPPENVSVAPDGRVHTRPVFNPGEWLKVVAVSDTSGGGVLDTVTVELARTGIDDGDQHVGGAAADTGDGFGRCEECVDDGGSPGTGANPGGVLRNAIDEPQWTLAPTPFVRAEGPNGGLRWEVQLDPTSSPFTDDREFEGWLLCADGSDTSDTWCARIIRTMADHHAATGESVVVWNDPTGHLEGGDRVDVYWARIEAGDRLIPVNVAEIQGDRTGTWVFEEGSGLGQTDTGLALEAIRFHDVGPAVASGRGEFLDPRNLHRGWRMDLVLFENYGGAGCTFSDIGGTSGCGTALRLDQSGAAQDFHDFRLDRVTMRAPNVDCYEGSDADDERFCAQGIILSHAGLPDRHWTDWTIRKFRSDWNSSAYKASQLSSASGCKDGFALQDALVYGGRNWKDQRFGLNSEELVETQGEGTGCAFDRLAIVSEIVGTPTILRCNAKQCAGGGRDQKIVTSLVTLGTYDGEILAGNDDPAVNNVAASNEFLAYGRLVNFAVDGEMRPQVNSYYGVLMDHWDSSPEAGPSISAFTMCGDSIGTYRIGGRITSQRAIACVAGGPTQPRWIDNYWSNVILGDPSARIFRYEGSIPISVQVLRSTFGFHLATMGSNLFDVSTPGGETGSTYELDRLWVVDPRPGSGGVVFTNGPYASPAAFSWGPNLYGNRDFRCDAGTEIFQDPLACIVQDGLAPGGDGVARTGMVENSPYAGAFSGEASGQGVAIVGNGALPASCSNAANPAPGAVDSCDFTEGGPRWAGPVAYDWPFAWATLDPVPGVRRSPPDDEFLPDHLAARVGPIAAACDNGVDDDGDGAIDFVGGDVGCESELDVSERSDALACDNGVDDDGDGRADFDPATHADAPSHAAGVGDPGCRDASWTREDPPCQDGVNNDSASEGLVDFDGGVSVHGSCTPEPGGCPPGVSDLEGDGVADPDPQCNVPWRSEHDTACGLGFELALFAPLAWSSLLRRRPRGRASGAGLRDGAAPS